MGLAETSTEELKAVLVDVVLSDQPLHVIRCNSPAEATRLRLRLNKVRITDRKQNVRAQLRDKVPSAQIEETSQFDKLVFQILPGGADIYIHKQAYAADSIQDRLYAGPDEQNLEKVRRRNLVEDAEEIPQTKPIEDLGL